MKRILLSICTLLIVSLPITFLAQNMELLLAEPMEDNTFTIPQQCSTEDMVVVIHSSILDLKFTSNRLPDDELIITHNKNLKRYIICHERMRFRLKISGENFQPLDIPIDDLEQSHVYRLSANVAKGKVNIITTPNNATVMFQELDDAIFSSNKAITNMSGKYQVKIMKPDFKKIDTVIVIPTDSTNTYEFVLIPEFSQLKLELNTWDNTEIDIPPSLWIDDSIRVSLDGMINPSIRVKNFDNDGVELYKLYENDIIPLPPGNHEIRIECENFTPSYEKYPFTKKGTITNFTVILEPVYGFITFIDDVNAEGAEVYVNGKLLGNIPIFREKIKVGENIIRIVKPGFITEEEELTAFVKQEETTQMYISMEVSKKVLFTSAPSKAQLFINDELMGFTPLSQLMHAGYHDVQFKKSGYSSVRIIKHINESSGEDETFHQVLLPSFPLNIVSEKEGLEIKLLPLDNKTIEIEGEYKTSDEVLTPYGRYELTLKDDGQSTFKGVINHNEFRKKNLVVPSYSRTSFQYLTGDFVNVENFEASFGRSMMFPNSGLSTSIINVQYNVFEIDSIKYKTVMPFVFLLNWDWRLGGSIFNQLDVCVLGRVKWTPGLKITNFQLSDQYYDASMWSYFIGIEISSRISYFNMNIKIGKQIMNGEVSIWDAEAEEYLTNGYPIRLDNFIISVGFTLNGKVFKNNNMLRLWKKPLAVKL